MQETPLDFCNDKRLDYLKEMASEEELHEFRFLDLRSDEEFGAENAALTAEGILKIIIEELPISLNNTHAAITGCGRVGSCTAELLQKTGCKITVFDINKSASDKFTVYGLGDFDTLAKDFDCVVNTVPSLILTEDRLKQLQSECVLIETASAPYGIDFKAADLIGLKTIVAGGLPGKVSPKTAAQLILRAIRRESEHKKEEKNE